MHCPALLWALLPAYVSKGQPSTEHVVTHAKNKRDQTIYRYVIQAVAVRRKEAWGLIGAGSYQTLVEVMRKNEDESYLILCESTGVLGS